MCAEVQHEAFLVKIANSNVMPTLRGFRWFPYFVALEYIVSGIRGKQMLRTSERSIFSENHDYNNYRKVFRCRDNKYYVTLKYIRIRNAFCIRKHVTENIRNIARGVGTKNGLLCRGK